MEKMDSKGQSSLEVLILIGGAILVATVIGVYLKSLPKNIGNRIEGQANSGLNLG